MQRNTANTARSESIVDLALEPSLLLKTMKRISQKFPNEMLHVLYRTYSLEGVKQWVMTRQLVIQELETAKTQRRPGRRIKVHFLKRPREGDKSDFPQRLTKRPRPKRISQPPHPQGNVSRQNQLQPSTNNLAAAAPTRQHLPPTASTTRSSEPPPPHAQSATFAQQAAVSLALDSTHEAVIPSQQYGASMHPAVVSRQGNTASGDPRNKGRLREQNRGPVATHNPQTNDRNRNHRTSRPARGAGNFHPYHDSWDARNAKIQRQAANAVHPISTSSSHPSTRVPLAGPSRLSLQPPDTTYITPMMADKSQSAPSVARTTGYGMSNPASLPNNRTTNTSQTVGIYEATRPLMHCVSLVGNAVVGQPAGWTMPTGPAVAEPQAQMYTEPSMSDNAALFAEYSACYANDPYGWMAPSGTDLASQLLPTDYANAPAANTATHIPFDDSVWFNPDFNQGGEADAAGSTPSAAQAWASQGYACGPPSNEMGATYGADAPLPDAVEQGIAGEPLGRVSPVTDINSLFDGEF